MPKKVVDLKKVDASAEEGTSMLGNAMKGESHLDPEAPRTDLVREDLGYSDAEIDLLKTLGIQAMVTKNSGGERPAKLDAARQLGLPVFLIDPPGRPKGGFDRWEDVRDALFANH